MIEMLVEDHPQDHWWKVTCDKCGTSQTYQTSAEIAEWDFRKTFFNPTEKHYCFSCQNK